MGALVAGYIFGAVFVCEMMCVVFRKQESWRVAQKYPPLARAVGTWVITLMVALGWWALIPLGVFIAIKRRSS